MPDGIGIAVEIQHGFIYEGYFIKGELGCNVCRHFENNETTNSDHFDVNFKTK